MVDSLVSKTKATAVIITVAVLATLAVFVLSNKDGKNVGLEADNSLLITEDLKITEVKPPVLKEKLSPNDESLFSEIDDEGNVLRTIVITQELINTGNWGDPAKWHPARQEGRLDYASKGDRIDLNKNYIIREKPTQTAYLDETTGIWIIPKPTPEQLMEEAILLEQMELYETTR